MYGTIYAKALTARGHWAMGRICAVTNTPLTNTRHMADALHFACESGREAGRLDAHLEVWCPHLLSDVPQLRDVWQREFETVRSQIDAMRTPAGINAWIAHVSKEANRGTGLVYEVFAQNFSEAIDNGLEIIPPELHSFTLERARCSGYETVEEREATWAAMREDGCCDHGLDYKTCPCGCFEGD